MWHKPKGAKSQAKKEPILSAVDREEWKNVLPGGLLITLLIFN